MRDRLLHDALRRLTEDAALLLESRLHDGHEIPFEVGEASKPRSGGKTSLFAYKPMTAEFVTSHADQLRTLPSFEQAAQNLARTRGTVAYLRLREEPVLDVGELTHARLGVLAFLSSVWCEAEHFSLWEERFQTAYGELESVVLAERLVTTVFIPVHGVVLDCEVVSLGAGVELLSAEDLDSDCLDRFSDAVTDADCFCAVSVDAPSNEPAPIAAVRRQARSLLTALRMFKPGSVSLGMTAQANVGGAWQQAAMPFSGRSREEAWRLLPGEDEELRQFIGAVRRVERRTRVAWALRRFEMGLERSIPAEGLTDFLAALRALLEVHDDTGKAALPARVSALCARDSERVHVRATVEAAFALERLAVDGHVGRADRKRLSKLPPLEVIAETERYLRALLHDLVCGYLSTDLRQLADEILLADGEPAGEATAAHDPIYLEPVPDPGEPPPPDPTATREFDAVFDDTAEIVALDTRAGDFEQPVGEEPFEDASFAEPPFAKPSPALSVVEDGAPPEDDNVWTLRPASEIKPAPDLSSDPFFDVEPDVVLADGVGADPQAHIPTYAENESDTRIRQLAEELVSEFDDALGRTLESDGAPDPRPEPGPAEPRPCEGLFGAAPAFTAPKPGERRRPRDGGLPKSGLSPEAALEDGFTFDFKVVEGAMDGDPAERPHADELGEPQVESPAQVESPVPTEMLASPEAPGRSESSGDAENPLAFRRKIGAAAPDGDFPVPEFRPPTVTGPASAAADDAVEARAQQAGFSQIMDENFTPPPRDVNERPSTPVARDGRPHLVAIDGAAAAAPRRPLPPPRHPQALRPGPQDTVEFDVLTDLADEPFAQPTAIEPEGIERPAPDGPSHRSEPQSSEHARTHAIGPATIEFRPLVDPDARDPDDFAGAC